MGPLEPPTWSTRTQLAAQASAPLMQAAALLSGAADAWMDLPDEALIAQGETSARMAAAFEGFLLPQLPGLAAAMIEPSARMLDVGTGIGAIARAFAATFSALHVTGIDVAERVLSIGKRLLEESSVKDRVELRRQSVADVAEVDAYDLVWVPAPFVPPEALGTGLERCARALRPGGWLLLGHSKLSSATPLEEALNHFKTLAYGGTALNDHQAAEVLKKVGLADVATLSTPPGAPALTVGRRPTAA